MSEDTRNLSFEDVSTGYEQLYELTGNPLYAWTEYMRCREAGREIPDWVLRYFDCAAWNLLGLSASPPEKEVASAVAEALEMKPTGKSGRGNVFTKLSLDKSSFKLASTMFSLILDEGHKSTIAAELAADQHGASQSTATRAMKKYFPELLANLDGLKLLRDRNNLEIALDVASYIEDGYERGLPVESLTPMALEYVAFNHNVSVSTAARAFDKYFPKKKYWTKP